MCGALEELMADRLREELQQGIERGIEQGIEQGIERGIEQGIKGLVEAVKEFTNSKEATINSLMKSYQLTEEVAKEKVELYWTE